MVRLDDGVPIAPYFTTGDWPGWFASAVGIILVPIVLYGAWLAFSDYIVDPLIKRHKAKKLSRKTLTADRIVVYHPSMTTQMEWNAKTIHNLLSNLKESGEIVTLDEAIEVVSKLAEAESFSERASP